MRRRGRAWVLACVVAVGSAAWAGGEQKPLPYPPAAVRVVLFQTDKVLYEPGETVVFHATLELTNAGASLEPSGSLPAAPLVAEVWDEHDLAAPVKVAEATLDAKRAAGNVAVELRWQPGEKRYGHRAHLRVRDGAGRRLAEAGTLYEVCREWQYVIRLAATAGANVVHQRLSEADLKRVVGAMRRGGANTLEIFGGWHRFYDLTPDTPTWSSAYYPKGTVSAANIRRLSDLLHAAGMRLVMYNETSVVAPDLFADAGTADAHRVYRHQRDGSLVLSAPYGREKGWFAPNALKIADRFASELAASIKRFGWDGVLCDSATQAFYSTAHGVDAQGKRLTDLTPGQVGVRYFGPARRAARQANPRFRVICQNLAASALLRHYHWRVPDDKLEATVADYFRKTYGGLTEAIDCWSAEMDPHYGNQKAYPQTYDEYAHVLNVGRAVTGKPILLWMHVSNPHVAEEYGTVYVRPLLSVLAASRVMWHDHFSNYGGWWGPWRDAPVNRVQVQVHRFACRFSRYLRAPDLEWMRNPEACFEVASSRELLWRRTVYRRSAAGGETQWVVNLLNLDSPYVRPSNVGKPPHVTPAVAFPTTVRFRLPRAVRADTVEGYVADAEDAELRVLRLPVQTHKGSAVFAIPPIRSWHLLVIRASQAT